MNQGFNPPTPIIYWQIIAYTQGNRPDENEIRKVIKAYEDRNWLLVQRSENAQNAEDRIFSLLQFRHVMQCNTCNAKNVVARGMDDSFRHCPHRCQQLFVGCRFAGCN